MSMIDIETGARTALGGPQAPADLSARLTEAPLRGMIALKGDLSSASLIAAVETAVGVAPPATRRVAAVGGSSAIWMAPDELLLTLAYAEAPPKTALIREMLGAEPHMVETVSDARAVFRLSGGGARETLAKGAPIDLHPQNFRPGDVRRTRLAQVACAIHQLETPDPDAGETFELFCFRSYADYVWRWLAASARAGAQPGVFPAAERG